MSGESEMEVNGEAEGEVIVCSCSGPKGRNIVLHKEVWMLQINGQKVSSKVSERVVDHILGGENFRRWERKERMSTDTCINVNWEACGWAMESLKIGRQQWVTKHIAGHAGVGTKMVQWGKKTTDACPRCAGESEDTRHVWVC
jgi:hypothetical protein